MSAQKELGALMAELEKQSLFVLSVKGWGDTVRAVPDWERARKTCTSLIEQLPMTCKANDTLVAGDTFNIDLNDDTYIDIDRFDKNMVERNSGLWYFYAPFRVLCIHAGERLNETNPVNGYAQTIKDDLEKARNIVEYIKRQLSQGIMVEITISLIDGPTPQPPLRQTAGRQWQIVPFEAHSYHQLVRSHGPEVLEQIVIAKADKFKARVDFLKAYTMTETTYFFEQSYRYNRRQRSVTSFKEDIDDHFFANFNVFVFLQDLAVKYFKSVGEQLKENLSKVETMDDLKALVREMHVFFGSWHATVNRLCVAKGWGNDQVPAWVKIE